MRDIIRRLGDVQPPPRWEAPEVESWQLPHMSWGQFFAACRRPLPLLAVLGSALGLFLLGGAIYADPHGLFGEITAAWVQAVGSIAAIVAAIWIAHRAALQASAERHAVRVEKVEVVRYLSQQLLDALSEATRQTNRIDPARFDPENFDSVRKALDEIPLVELPRGRLAISVINQRRAAFFFQRAFEDWVNRDSKRRQNAAFIGTAPPDFMHEIERQAAETDEVANELARQRRGAVSVHSEIEEELGLLKARLSQEGR